jgi:hypothetical protein
MVGPEEAAFEPGGVVEAGGGGGVITVGGEAGVVAGGGALGAGAGAAVAATTGTATFMPPVQCPGKLQMKYLVPVEFRVTISSPVCHLCRFVPAQASYSAFVAYSTTSCAPVVYVNRKTSPTRKVC